VISLIGIKNLLFGFASAAFICGENQLKQYRMENNARTRRCLGREEITNGDSFQNLFLSIVLG